MAADRALAKHNQRARQNIRAFDRDADWHLLIGAANQVGRPEHDAFAAQNIHRIDDDVTAHLGHMQLGNRRGDSRLLTEINRRCGHDAGRIHHVSGSGNAGQRLLHAFEFSDRRLELAAHPCIGTDRTRGQLGKPGRERRQRDRTPRRQALHQHAPALARHGRPADDPVERHEHVAAPVRPVLKRGVERPVAPADVDARRVGGHQHAGDAEVFAATKLVTEQLLRVVQLDGKAKHGADRPQRDVALVPGHTHAQYLFTLPRALADDADIGNGGGIRPCHRVGQRKGRHVDALGQARQVIVLLRFGAVVNQQLSRPQRIWHHHRHRQRAGARAQLHHHLRMQIRRKLQAAIFFRNNHPEKTLVLDELPHLRRQVLIHMGGVPVVAHCAHLLDLVVEKRNLGRRQARLRVSVQHIPVRLAGKQLTLPPHRAGVNRLLLGLRHRR